MDSFTDKIINGDSEIVLKDIPDESVDLMVTDPPYGLTSPGSKNATGGFMGKAWDKAVPSVAVWKESLRVLKPGTFAFIMCIPRQDCLARMIVNLEDAGFMVNFSPIYHTFATGFPKAANLSKLADRRAGVEREVVGDNIRLGDKKAYPKNPSKIVFHPDNCQTMGKITAPATPEAKALEGSYAGYQPKPAVEVVLVAMKPLTEKTYLDQALANGKGCTWLDDGKIPYESDSDQKTHRYNMEGNLRHKTPKTIWGTDSLDKDKTVNQSPQGRFAPNLLCEDDVLNDGKVRCPAGNKTPGRIDGTDNSFVPSGIREKYPDSGSYSRYFSLDAWSEKHLPESVNKGRFAPNLLVSDDCLNDGKVTYPSYRNGDRGRGNRIPLPGSTRIGNGRTGLGYPDSGSYSRYFSLDSWAEKNLPESAKRTFPFLIVPKASKREKNAGLDGLDDKQKYKGDKSGGSHECFNNPEHRNERHRHTPEPTKNHHATVKPIKLGSYLTMIGSRAGDIVLDPFCGSGSFCIAAAILDRHYCGIELDAEMCDISKRRIKWHVEQAEKETEQQLDIFTAGN